jgi:hypothetical protein
MPLAAQRLAGHHFPGECSFVRFCRGDTIDYNAAFQGGRFRPTLARVWNPNWIQNDRPIYRSGEHLHDLQWTR